MMIPIPPATGLPAKIISKVYYDIKTNVMRMPWGVHPCHLEQN